MSVNSSIENNERPVTKFNHYLFGKGSGPLSTSTVEIESMLSFLADGNRPIRGFPALQQEAMSSTLHGPRGTSADIAPPSILAGNLKLTSYGVDN
jgi:hypothetical protein